jgi:nucleotide-binding universal stress UspA family protein
MLKHILVPLDGSKLAEQALAHALDIIAPDGKITLVCAVEIPDVPDYGFYQTIGASRFEESKNELLPIAQHYTESIAYETTRKGTFTRFEVMVGNPATIITEAAERLAVDAIVMSTHGRSGIGRFLFGSVTHKVLDANICPVFVIPSKVTVTQDKPVAAAELVQ